MKLRTLLMWESRPTRPILGTHEDVSHDAIAAHALMQAMAEFDCEGWSVRANPIEWARERAEEILREWTKT